MAKVIILPGHNARALAALAGSNLQGLFFRPDDLELEVPDVTQSALDAALVDYTANQAARDADFADIVADEKTDEERDKFDDKSDLTALIKEMVDQLNALRTLHGLPDLNFGVVNAAIRSGIGQP